MTTVTGREIRLEVGRILRQRDVSQFWEIVHDGGGASAAVIIDSAALGTSALTAQSFMDYYLRASDTSGTAPDGDKTRARALTLSTGSLALSPSVSGNFATGDTAELWKIDPDDVDRARDRARERRLTVMRLTPLSWVLDPDFLVDAAEDATPTHWTASSATATVTTRSGLERFSERVLRVANSGANGYAGQTVNVPSGAGSGGAARTWYFCALAQADTGTARVTVTDLTNTADLQQQAIARTTWAGEAFNAVSFTVETAATTEQMSLRLGAAGASDDIYWGPVCFYPADAAEFVLPARIVNRSRIGLFYEYNVTDWPEDELRPLPQQPQLFDVGGGQVKAIFPGPVGARAIVYEEFANYPAMQSIYNTRAGRVAGDAATTFCPLEYAAWGTLRELIGEEAEEEWQRAHARHGAKKRVRFARDW